MPVPCRAYRHRRWTLQAALTEIPGLDQLRADGFDVHDEDVDRLSPLVRHHINMPGRNSFKLPDLPDGLRPLRDREATKEE